MKKYIQLLIFLVLFPSFLPAQNEFYDVMPDIDNCQEGQLKAIEKQKILAKVNSIRAIHGLKPVTYNNSKDIYVQKSALLTAANEMLSHQPPSSWKCYSPEGATGSQSSNLHIRWFYGSSYGPSEDAVNSWMIDLNVEVCGHRRWIIDPFLKFIAFGRVDGKSVRNPQFNVTAASLYVIDNDKQDISDWDGDFVAYPYHNYPSELVMDQQGKFWHFSFTAVFNKSNWWDNHNVSFDNATLEIKDDNNNNVAFNNVVINNEGYGVPNMLRFDIVNPEKDKRYNVTVKNVSYKGQTKDFTYWFKISDNVPTLPPAPTLVSPADGSTDLPIDLTLQWENISNAASYYLQVSKKPDFTQLIVSETDIAINSYNLSSLEKDTKYYWRVAATNEAGTSDWSDTFTFTTGKGTSIGIPILVYPGNNATSVPTNAKIQWQAVDKAESYHLQISDTKNFPTYGLPVDQQNIPVNYYTVPHNQLKENTQYWYRVRAYADGNFSDWSEVYSFWTWIFSNVDNEIDLTNSISIVPNPSNGKFKITTSLFDNADVKLFNLSGELLLSYNNTIINKQFDISNLPSGVYIAIITNGDKHFVKQIKIIK